MTGFRRHILLICLSIVASLAFAENPTKPYTGFNLVDEHSQGLWRTALPSANGQTLKVPYTRQALQINGISVLISEEQYYNWGMSPLEVDGKIHVFHARWLGNMENWTQISQIVHYVADQPEGPFTYVGQIFDNEILKDTGFRSPHNPRLERVDGKFALFFIAQGKARADCSIFLATADDINGPWELVGEDGIVLSGSDDPSVWCYNSEFGVANPAFIKVGDKYHLYFKTGSPGALSGGYGVAVADNLEGPYVFQKERATENTTYLEDAQAFEWNGLYYLLLNDNFGSLCGIPGAQILWESKDGLKFKKEDVAIASGIGFDYWGKSEEDRQALYDMKGFNRHSSAKFERPAYLFIDGNPAYLYAACCMNLSGGRTPETYVMKLEGGNIETITHTRSDDAFLQENQADTIQESSKQNMVGGDGSSSQFVTLMKFSLAEVYADLGATGGTIRAVKLNLGPAMTSGDGVESNFVGHLWQYTDFDAATATWNTPDGSIANDSTPGGTYGAETLLASETFTIADAPKGFSSTPALVAYIQAAYDNGDSEVYFRLGNDGESEDIRAWLRTDQGDVQGDGKAVLTVFSDLPQAPPKWKNDLIVDSTYANYIYQGSVAGEAIDVNIDLVTYNLVSGPTWLNMASNGVLSGTPLMSNLGTNTFTIAATDGMGTNEATLKIIVNEAIAPEWKTDPILGANGYVSVVYNGTLADKATDANGDLITYSLVGGSTWLQVADDGTLSGMPAISDVGTNTFTVAAFDGIDTTEATLNIVVADGATFITHTRSDDAFLRENQGNTIQESGKRNMFGGDGSSSQFITLMKFSLADIYAELGTNGGTVTAVQLDLGPAMTSGNGTVPDFVGHIWKYTSFDAANATWNNPTGSMGNDTTPGGFYSAETLLASQTFSIAEVAPATHAFSSTTAMVKYVQTAYDNGDSEVYFRLSNDGESENLRAWLRTDQGSVRGDGQAHLIIVTDNTPAPLCPPEWKTDSVTGVNGYVGVEYDDTLAGKATDANGDPITYSLIDGPSWLNVAPDGVLSGMPTTNDMGTNTFTVAATDGISGTNEAVLNIFIGVAVAPAWLTDPFRGLNGYVGTAYDDTLAGKATDANDDPITYSLISNPTWLNVAADGALSGTPASENIGMNTFVVAASDGIDTTEATLNVFVGAVAPLPVEIMNDGFEAATTLSGNGWDTSLNVSWTMSTSNYGNPRYYIYGAGNPDGNDPAHKAGVISKNSGHIIQSGEKITLAFDVLDTSTAAVNGVILAKLYYNNGVSNVVLGSVEVVDPKGGGWKEKLGMLAVHATADSVGHTLFVSFEGSGGNGLSAQRLGIDNVIITSLSIVGEAVTVAIVAPVLKGSEMILSWGNQVGVAYSVETNANLIDGIWNTWTSGVSGVDATISLIPPIAEDKIFFRVITE